MSYGRFFEGGQGAATIVSVKERMIGISQMNSEGRMEFPRQLVIGEEDPLVCQAVNPDGDDYDDLRGTWNQRNSRKQYPHAIVQPTRTSQVAAVITCAALWYLLLLLSARQQYPSWSQQENTFSSNPTHTTNRKRTVGVSKPSGIHFVGVNQW